MATEVCWPNVAGFFSIISSMVNLRLAVQIFEKENIIDQPTLHTDSSRIRCLLLFQSLVVGGPEAGQVT